MNLLLLFLAPNFCQNLYKIGAEDVRIKQSNGFKTNQSINNVKKPKYWSIWWKAGNPENPETEKKIAKIFAQINKN